MALDQTPTTDLGKGLEALQKACPGYEKANNYYCGALPEIFADLRLRAAIQRTGLSLSLNFSHNVVDAVSDRLELVSYTASDDVPNTVLTEIWDDNQLGLQAPNAMRKAGIFGDAYVLVWIADGAEDERRVKIRYQDPRTVRVVYADDDPLTPAYAIKRWDEDYAHPLMHATQTRHYVDLYYADRIEHYESKPGAKGDREEDYIPSTVADSDGDNDAPPHGPVEDNPFGEIPIKHLRTGADCYGEPEHAQVYSAQDAIHEAVLDLVTTLVYSGHPQRWRLLDAGADTSQSTAGDEAFYTYALQSSGDTRPIMGEPKSQLKSSPGSLWELTNTKAVGQFDAADSRTFLDTINAVLRYMALISNTPFSRLDPSGVVPSGEALRTLEAPFVRKVRNRQLAYGAVWQEIFEFALKLAGHDGATVDVRWAPAASTDDADTWNLVQAKQASGVPAAITLMEAGYDAEMVGAWMKDSGFVLNQKMAALVQLGEFLASAATATAAGVIGAETVQQVIENVVGDLATAPSAE
ncbi:SPP1 Gp6-like portal protein [Amycolatopsis echigonensis]|uniref:SPP1 Gp6-like portal protein n=1 Tax=Amycolatopsis echigonensis TaxID=2576905 RepID=A0A2N3WPW1_9PSEU|nr:phage portal protein [Amycolatopsis niigatensis]PKV95915.1 SPP1 Gp6-like portal protein [Amycolatopsis niigatensis]